MVEVVGRNYFILDTLVIELDCVLGVVAPEHKEVFNRELVKLRPSDLQALLLGLGRLQSLFVEQVKNLLIVNLEETTADCDCAILHQACLREHVSDCSSADSSVKVADYDFASPIVFTLLRCVLVALHRKSFARSSLAICEHCSVEPFKHLSTKTAYLQLIKDL